MGKTTVQVMSQVEWQMGLQVSRGTMESNAGMRSVMRSLRVEEGKEVANIPGRGVVAELAYSVKRGMWVEVEMGIEFMERGRESV